MHTITMELPNKNALGTAAMEWLIGELDRASGAPLLLRGKGAFSAGLDLREVASLDEHGMRAFLVLLERCMTSLYLYPGPTVAFVDGHAIAGGSILALACDRSVAVDDAKLRIGLNEVALGVRFPPRILAIVKQQLPPSTLDEVILGAGLFAPKDAVRVGLIDELGDESVAIARLEAYAKHPPDAYAWTKARLRGDEDHLCPAAEHDAIVRTILSAWASPAVKARLGAVLERGGASKARG